MTLSLFFLMGVSWSAEVVSFAVGGSVYVWLPFDVLNVFTAAFMFAIFACKPSIWKLLKHRFPSLARLDGCCPSFMTRARTTVIKTSSSGKRQSPESRSSLSINGKRIDTVFNFDKVSKQNPTGTSVTVKIEK